MKISNLAYLTRSQLTSLATAMAQVKVGGFKATAKTIISVFAALESKSVEAMLAEIDKRHSEAYSVNKKAYFLIKDGKERLIEIDVKIDVTGFANNYISIFNGMYSFDEDCVSDNIYPSISAGGRNSSYSIKETNDNLQLAINYAFELCNHLSKVRKNAKIKDFEKEGWTVICKK